MEEQNVIRAIEKYPITAAIDYRLERLAFAYQTYRALFHVSEARNVVLSPAGRFFVELQSVYVDWMFTMLCTLASKPTVGRDGHEQVCFVTMIGEHASTWAANAQAKMIAEALLAEFTATTKRGMQDHRDGRIAHADKTKLVDRIHPLPPVTVGNLREAFEQAIALYEHVVTIAGLPERGFDQHKIYGRSADDLVAMLEDGQRFQQLRHWLYHHDDLGERSAEALRAEMLQAFFSHPRQSDRPDKSPRAVRR